jgi:MFS family permease
MSDPAPVSRRKPDVAFIATGIASSLMYASVILSFAFLVPVQLAFGRYGRRLGLAAAGISAACIALVQGWRLAAAGAYGAMALAAGVLPPLVLLGALALVNAPFWRDWAAPYRILCVTAACSLAALPLVYSLGRDASISAFLEERIGSFLAPLRAATGEGYEASALAASLDPRELVATSLATLRDSYAAIVLFLVGGGWRLGNRLSGSGSPGREETVAIDGLRLPYPLLWAFLASWSLVLAAVLIHAPTALSALAWNCALVMSVAYGAQGLGIVTFLLKSWNMPRSLRIALAVIAVLALATPTAGLAVAVGLPLLGVTEIWIPYRKPKGAGA